jgi:hypothetical protein
MRKIVSRTAASVFTALALAGAGMAPYPMD